MRQKYTWTVELSVDASWVADGFRLDDERAREMLARELPYAYDYEIEAKVIKSPDQALIAHEQSGDTEPLGFGIGRHLMSLPETEG